MIPIHHRATRATPPTTKWADENFHNFDIPSNLMSSKVFQTKTKLIFSELIPIPKVMSHPNGVCKYLAISRGNMDVEVSAGVQVACGTISQVSHPGDRLSGVIDAAVFLVTRPSYSCFHSSLCWASNNASPRTPCRQSATALHLIAP